MGGYLVSLREDLGMIRLGYDYLHNRVIVFNSWKRIYGRPITLWMVSPIV
jgi:hypothetical protein